MFITSSSLEFVGAYMNIIDVAGFPWNVLINILSECDITSHSEFIDLLFNIIPIPPVDAP